MQQRTLDRLPLESVRVVDMTQAWAGPYATKFLADMGAEVIKVESTRRPDAERMAVGPRRSPLYPDYEPGERFFNRKAEFVEYNRNKLSMTLDLTAPAGVALFTTLAQVSDVVVENFSVGVMDRFGLGYEVLRQVRPDLIMLAMPGFGATGPEARYRAYGPVQEAMSGLTSITGYPDEPFLETREYYGDPTAGVFGAAALFAALLYRRRTGRGVFIDLSQREAMIACLPELVLEHVMAGRTLRSTANRHPFKAPHGCYRCAGEDNWLALSAGTDEEWQALCRAMGRPELAAGPRFATALERLTHQDELDRVIEAWTRERDHLDLMRLLQDHGVAAEAVVNVAELARDPHFQARGFLERVPHPDAGEHLTTGISWKISDVPARIRLPAPGLGQHNRPVICDLIGLPQTELEALEQAGIIGDYPAGFSREAAGGRPHVLP